MSFKDKVDDPVAVANEMAQAHSLGLRHTYTAALRGFAAVIPPGRVQALRNDPRVDYIEPDLIAHAIGQTLPTGVDRIDADLNATANIDGVDDRVDVDIAIIDTGIDLDHPDLNVFANVNFNNPKRSGDDDNGHGTHVAGTAAALDNGIGVVGVAPGAKLWAVKVLDRKGSGSFSDVIAGIDYVTLNAANIEVVNMSLGGTGTLNSLRTAIQNSVAAGVVYVSVAQPAPIMRAYVAVRKEGEAFIRASNLNSTVLRPWYVLGPGHRWPYLLLPLYAILEQFPATRDGALRLGLVTLSQMVAALVRAVESPAEGVRVVEVPEIRSDAATAQFSNTGKYS